MNCEGVCNETTGSRSTSVPTLSEPGCKTHCFPGWLGVFSWTMVPGLLVPLLLGAVLATLLPVLETDPFSFSCLGFSAASSCFVVLGSSSSPSSWQKVWYGSAPNHFNTSSACERSVSSMCNEGNWVVYKRLAPLPHLGVSLWVCANIHAADDVGRRLLWKFCIHVHLADVYWIDQTIYERERWRMLDVFWNNSSFLLEGDSDAEVAEMWTKERNGFFLIQKEERGTDEQHIWVLMATKGNVKRRRMGARPIKNEANPHSGPLRLCPRESFAWWNPIYKPNFGGIISWWWFFPPLQAKSRQRLHRHAFPLRSRVDQLDGRSECFLWGPGSGFQQLKGKGVYIR